MILGKRETGAWATTKRPASESVVYDQEQSMRVVLTEVLNAVLATPSSLYGCRVPSMTPPAVSAR